MRKLAKDYNESTGIYESVLETDAQYAIDWALSKGFTWEDVEKFEGNYYREGFAPQQPEPSYEEQRVEEYPPMADFLDAQVKINSGDEVLMAEGQAQLDKYVADCLAVKAKYPKPEESIKESVAAE